ncbi:MAG: NlpC/P60 family protein [Bacillota bacterium]|nr:NlpC/P60 family protein [Bacillota bacterium]
MTNKKMAVKTFFCAVIFTVCLIASADAINVSVGSITASTALNLRSGPSASSSVSASIPSGSKILVFSKGSWVCASFNGKVGYISSKYVSVKKNGESRFGEGLVTGSSVNMRKDSSTGANIIETLSKGTRVEITGVKNDWYKVTVNGKTGYISSDYITTAVNMPAVTKKAGAPKKSEVKKSKESSGGGSEIVDYAKKYLGVKYRSGGSSPKGFDCSGFTSYVYKHFGINLSHASKSQYKNCDKIEKSELKEGDLVFFANPRKSSKGVGHVGIYIGNNAFIHASSPGDVVKITSLSETYYLRNYIGSGRINS